MIKNVFIFNPVRPDFIHKAIDTLYQYTDMSANRVVVVDQTMDQLKLDSRVHMVLRPHRNLGFSKSMNEGIIHALRWEGEYITCANDDIEYINAKWWDGILETFKMGENILAVNPECPRIPLWGYGRPHGEYFDILPYKQTFTDQDYEYLLKGDLTNQDLSHLPKTFPKQKNGIVDGIATWHTTFKREFFEKIGMWEERYYPGGGEDYDLNARAYREKFRMVGTTKSWVWHHWGASKDQQQSTEMKDNGLPILDELRWMKPHELWPPELNLSWNSETKQMEPKNMDPWARLEQENGSFKPMIRQEEIGVIEI